MSLVSAAASAVGVSSDAASAVPCHATVSLSHNTASAAPRRPRPGSCVPLSPSPAASAADAAKPAPPLPSSALPVIEDPATSMAESGSDLAVKLQSLQIDPTSDSSITTSGAGSSAQVGKQD